MSARGLDPLDVGTVSFLQKMDLIASFMGPGSPDRDDQYNAERDADEAPFAEDEGREWSPIHQGHRSGILDQESAILMGPMWAAADEESGDRHAPNADPTGHTAALYVGKDVLAVATRARGPLPPTEAEYLARRLEEQADREMADTRELLHLVSGSANPHERRRRPPSPPPPLECLDRLGPLVCVAPSVAAVAMAERNLQREWEQSVMDGGIKGTKGPAEKTKPSSPAAAFSAPLRPSAATAEVLDVLESLRARRQAEVQLAQQQRAQEKAATVQHLRRLLSEVELAHRNADVEREQLRTLLDGAEQRAKISEHVVANFREGAKREIAILKDKYERRLEELGTALAEAQEQHHRRSVSGGSRTAHEGPFSADTCQGSCRAGAVELELATALAELAESRDAQQSAVAATESAKREIFALRSRIEAMRRSGSPLSSPRRTQPPAAAGTDEVVVTSTSQLKELQEELRVCEAEKREAMLEARRHQDRLLVAQEQLQDARSELSRTKQEADRLRDAGISEAIALEREQSAAALRVLAAQLEDVTKEAAKLRAHNSELLVRMSNGSTRSGGSSPRRPSHSVAEMAQAAQAAAHKTDQRSDRVRSAAQSVAAGVGSVSPKRGLRSPRRVPVPAGAFSANGVVVPPGLRHLSEAARRFL